MKTDILEISDQKIWEKFNIETESPSIFQSWSFTQSLLKQDLSLKRFGIYINKKLTGIAAVSQTDAKRGRFLHIRGGPILKNWERDFPVLLNFLKSNYIDFNPWFIRLSPPILKEDMKTTQIIKKNGGIDVVIPLLDAETAWILDIEKNEQELLLEMRKTTRYLVKKAQKMGVEISINTSDTSINKLLDIYKIMVSEKGITPHKGIKQEFEEFRKENHVVVITGSYQGKVLGAALIIFYGDEGIYHHSAHLREGGVPVSYLMQWEAILESKRRGKKRYNFWGIEPSLNPKHPWYGLSLFKKGFGGSLRQFIQAQDIPLLPYYNLTRAIEIARKVKRYRSF